MIEPVLRIVAGAAAVVLGARIRRGGHFFFSVALAIAAFGFTAGNTDLLSVVLETAGFVLLSGVFLFRTWPPVALDALRESLVLAVGPAVFAAVPCAGNPVYALAQFLLNLLAILMFGAHLSWSNTEAGSYRFIGWLWAVAAPVLLAGGGAFLLKEGVNAGVLCGIFGLLAVLSFGPLFVLESRRVKRELGEEAAMGFLPPPDVEILAHPWRRLREKSYGRRDERREFVKSALMLAIARQQQRRRKGEHARLRQLEVLAFRTRVRRLVDVRASRLIQTDEAVI